MTQRSHVGQSSRGSGNGIPPNRQQSNIDLSRIVFGESIDAKLYSDIAEQAAITVGEGGKAARRNKPSQLRRYYDELVALQEKVGSRPERFDEQLPFIQMLKAKITYAQGRETVTLDFVALLKRVIDQAQNADSLKQARLFMEAFMAFYKVHGPREG